MLFPFIGKALDYFVSDTITTDIWLKEKQIGKPAH